MRIIARGHHVCVTTNHTPRLEHLRSQRPLGLCEMEHRFSYPQVLEIRRGTARSPCPAFPTTQQVPADPSPLRRPERARGHRARRADTEGDR
jgi:hypothetical protein